MPPRWTTACSRSSRPTRSPVDWPASSIGSAAHDPDPTRSSRDDNRPMSGSVRLTAVLTHPVQYYAPWFRHIAAHCPEIDLTVLYAADPTPAQRGVGFGVGLE